jgi:2-iminobutanoate/2-iminopropanoate deaminase
MNFTKTNDAPSAIGPYSQAVCVNDMVYTSGQIALTIDGKDDILSQGIKEQTTQVLKNLQNVLKASNSDKSKVIKCNIFLANMEDFGIINGLYEEFFGNHKPARSTVAVKTLPKNALIEIDAIAVIK